MKKFLYIKYLLQAFVGSKTCRDQIRCRIRFCCLTNGLGGVRDTPLAQSRQHSSLWYLYFLGRETGWTPGSEILLIDG